LLLRFKIFILYPVKINILKLSPFLAQFLFTNKQLNLAGLGKFILGEAGEIVFQQDTAVGEDPQLVGYIAEKSGKMKSLIAADLDSNLELARQFLNIGKPYLFEGIGTLSKNKTGNYEFVQNNPSQERSKEFTGEGRDVTSTTENSFTGYVEMFSPKRPTGPTAKQMITWFIAIAGLSLAVFGGYLIYTRAKNKQRTTSLAKKQEPVMVSQDSLVRTDSIAQSIKEAESAATPPGMYRFVIEKATRQRAISRYTYLKNNFIDVKMDTKDSVLFKLYFLLPASPADTAHKRDSLQRLYGTRGKTIIELK